MVFAVSEPALSITSADAEPGGIVELNVVIENNPGINTFALGFDYDDSTLELLDVTVDDNLGGQFVYKKKAVWLNSEDIQYNGSILTLKFRVSDDAQSGESEIKLTYSLGDISNYDEENINFKVYPGVITVKNGNENISFLQRIMMLFNRIIELIKSLFI